MAFRRVLLQLSGVKPLGGNNSADSAQLRETSKNIDVSMQEKTPFILSGKHCEPLSWKCPSFSFLACRTRTVGVLAEPIQSLKAGRVCQSSSRTMTASSSPCVLFRTSCCSGFRRPPAALLKQDCGRINTYLQGSSLRPLLQSGPDLNHFDEGQRFAGLCGRCQGFAAPTENHTLVHRSGDL